MREALERLHQNIRELEKKTHLIMALENKESVPEDLREEWESYLATCESLEVEPSLRRFLRYNELYPLNT